MSSNYIRKSKLQNDLQIAICDNFLQQAKELKFGDFKIRIKQILYDSSLGIKIGLYDTAVKQTIFKKCFLCLLTAIHSTIFGGDSYI